MEMPELTEISEYETSSRGSVYIYIHIHLYIYIYTCIRMTLIVINQKAQVLNKPKAVAESLYCIAEGS